MKRILLLGIALALCLLFLPILPTPMQAAPGISVSPSAGYVGDELVLFGTFTSHWGETVYIYYEVTADEWEHVDTAEISADSGPSQDERVLVGAAFDVPKSSRGDHAIRVCYQQNPSKKISGAETLFTVQPRVKISVPRSASGPVGTQVEVEGTGFAPEEKNLEILFSGDAVSTRFTADWYGTWTGTFEVPTAREGKHYVSARGRSTDEDDVKKATFTVEPGVSLSIQEGYVGDTLTVHGSGFFASETGIQVTYDGAVQGEPTKADPQGAWELSFAIPPSTEGTHKIDAYGGSTRAADIEDRDFDVQPTVTLEPGTGYVGTPIGVAGTGFPADTVVKISYDGDDKGSATTDEAGSFSGMSFEATHTQAVHTTDHPVQADYDATKVTTVFSMEDEAPPAPTVVSPADGARVGFLGEGTPTFVWDIVTDNSGVSHYELRLAADPEFADVLVAQHVAAEAGEKTVTYTVPEALPYGTYYWQIRAIDRAQNIGPWSSTRSVQAGLLMLWTFIAIVVILVLVVGALIYIFVIRKRATPSYKK